jgi:hypothetical protein
VPDAAKQPTLELLLTGKVDGQKYTWRAVLGRSGDGPAETPIGDRWSAYRFPIEDLPLEGLSEAQVGFRLTGPGEVWIDDVQLCHLEFNRDELGQLSRMIYLAEVKLRKNQVGDCIRLLEGYWPRFLEDNVPISAVASRPVPGPARPHKSADVDDSPGLMDRMRALVPRKLW